LPQPQAFGEATPTFFKKKEKTMPPKVVVSIPKSLQTTADERRKLKSAFKTKIQSIVQPSGGAGPITNVGRVVTEIIVTNGGVRKTASKRRATKKKTT